MIKVVFFGIALFLLGAFVASLACRPEKDFENEIILQEHQLKVQELYQDYCFNVCEYLKYSEFFPARTPNSHRDCVDECLEK